MKKTAQFIYCSLILIILLQISVFAEPQLQYIEYWKDGTAYNSRNEVIIDCIAYDYLTDNTDKFVRLNAEGKEASRATVPNELTDINGQVTGTAELSAVVPDNIDNAVEVVLWDSNGNSYTLTAYKDNNYIAYANLPPGTYSVFSAGIKDDFKGEYPAKCDMDEIIIESSTASKLEVIIAEKQDLTNPLTYTGVDSENDSLQSYETPDTEHDDTYTGIDVDTKSLLKSTIITFSVLVILFLSYRIVIWYRNRKNTEAGGD
ncbi:MAG: hypothetical protein J1F01_00720 [Oscillospiraceae bacterium]|nr:hypothetical protein [Oscillospiraceae bacterium]